MASKAVPWKGQASPESQIHPAVAIVFPDHIETPSVMAKKVLRNHHLSSAELAEQLGAEFHWTPEERRQHIIHHQRHAGHAELHVRQDSAWSAIPPDS